MTKKFSYISKAFTLTKETVSLEITGAELAVGFKGCKQHVNCFVAHLLHISKLSDMKLDIKHVGT